MRVLFFGSYLPEYSRNRVLVKGLKKNGVDVIHCCNRSRIFLRYPKLLKKYRGDCDAVIVGFPGSHLDIPLARFLTKLNNQPLIFDALISTYDTLVSVRRKVKKNSLKAKYLHFREKLAYKIPDMILTDTHIHIDYIHDEFGIEKGKMNRIFTSTDEEVFYPRKVSKKENSFLLTFYGYFQPLHGAKHIIKAAKILESYENISFELLGSGQSLKELISLKEKLNVENVYFRKPVKYEKLPEFAARGDVCLGIFGDTRKSKRVIPNKVIEALALKKPLITGKTPAMKELGLKNNENAKLTELADPNGLAEAILELKEKEGKRKRIAENGWKLFKNNFTTKIIGRKIKRLLKEIANA